MLKAVEDLTGWKGVVMLAGIDPRSNNILVSKR
jgi:hypothetical protein